MRSQVAPAQAEAVLEPVGLADDLRAKSVSVVAGPELANPFRGIRPLWV
jgi:hypothetical protein